MNYGSNWNTQRQKVLERDDYECRVCGRSKGDAPQQDWHSEVRLEVHHKLPVAVFNEVCDEVPEGLMNHPRNLITLCQNCHNAATGEHSHVGKNAVNVSGDVRSEYYVSKPRDKSHNEFVSDLLNAARNPNESDIYDKRDAFRDLKHDLQDMIREELDRFGERYLR